MYYVFVLVNILFVGFCKFLNILYWNDKFFVIVNNIEFKVLFFYLWDKVLECSFLFVVVWRVLVEIFVCCDLGYIFFYVGILGNICYWGGFLY